MTGKRHIVSKIYLPAFFVFFILATVGGANGQDVSSTSTIIDRLDKKLGVSVPAEYSAKLLNFVLNDTIMHTRSATAYTEEFIINEMKKDWGINKQNQLLFIWSEIYGGITGGKLYDILDDEDDNRYSEYDKNIEKINKSYEEYKKGFKTYIEKGIADADRRISDADRRISDADRRIADAEKRTADADRRIADADRRIADADSLTAQYRRESAKALEENMKADSLGLKEIIKFYHIYERNPKIVRQEEIAQTRENAKLFINDCIKHGINYRAILLKEVGDKKKVEEILKFYGVE